jgi:hypothetical protein
MNFDHPGWLDRYQQYRSAHPLPRVLPTVGMRLFEQIGVHHEQDQATYLFLQPTGLLYGFPLVLPFPDEPFPDQEYLHESNRVLLIWLDAMFACLVADRHYLLDGMHEETDPFPHALRALSYYFIGERGERQAGLGGLLERMRTTMDRLPLGRNRPHHGRLERELVRRTGDGAALLSMPDYAYNGFLFLDLYYSLLWQRTLVTEPGLRQVNLAKLRNEQREVREALLKLLIVAAHSSGDVDAGERRVFERFLRSSGMARSRKAALRKFMRTGLSLDQVKIPESPWLVRRHLLDLTLMLILADRNFTEAEQRFVAELGQRLGLWEEELEQSQAALLAFLLRNESKLHFLKERTHVRVLAERVAERAQVMLRKNLDRIVNEVRETRELYDLLVKSRNVALTAEEKQKVRAQLYDILKTIPTLAIFALPGGSVALPILIRLLPFNLLPTSFED